MEMSAIEMLAFVFNTGIIVGLLVVAGLLIKRILKKRA